MRLPTPRAGLAFERTHHVCGDPPAVEAPGLREYPLTANGAIEQPGHEREVAGDRDEPRCRGLVAPPDGLQLLVVAIDHVPIGCRALPFAHRAPGRGPLDHPEVDVGAGDV